MTTVITLLSRDHIWLPACAGQGSPLYTDGAYCVDPETATATLSQFAADSAKKDWQKASDAEGVSSCAVEMCGDAPAGKQFKSGQTKNTECGARCATQCWEGEVSGVRRLCACGVCGWTEGGSRWGMGWGAVRHCSHSPFVCAIETMIL